MRAALAQQQLDLKATAQLGQRPAKVEDAIRAAANVLNVGGGGRHGGGRAGHHDHVCARLGEQWDIGAKRHATGDHARDRLLAQAARATHCAAGLVADDAPIALGANSARACHHAVRDCAQRVKQLPVCGARYRARVPAQRCAPVGGADHVEQHPWPVGRGQRSLPQSELLDELERAHRLAAR